MQARGLSDRQNAAAVFQAQRLLDESTWSQTIQIRNKRTNSTYGSKVWALAFEFGGRVWIYLPQLGTQSPAVSSTQLDSDKADLSGLLAKVHPGFTSYKEVTADEKVVAQIQKDNDVPNACLMESLATLRKMVRSGVDVESADLLMFYAKVGSSFLGHTVLVYETENGLFAWDPERPQIEQPINAGFQSDALSIARVVAETGVRSKVAKAQLLNIEASDMGGTRVAGLAARNFATAAN